MGARAWWQGRAGRRGAAARVVLAVLVLPVAVVVAPWSGDTPSAANQAGVPADAVLPVCTQGPPGVEPSHTVSTGPQEWRNGQVWRIQLQQRGCLEQGDVLFPTKWDPPASGTYFANQMRITPSVATIDIESMRSTPQPITFSQEWLGGERTDIPLGGNPYSPGVGFLRGWGPGVLGADHLVRYRTASGGWTSWQANTAPIRLERTSPSCTTQRFWEAGGNKITATSLATETCDFQVRITNPGSDALNRDFQMVLRQPWNVISAVIDPLTNPPAPDGTYTAAFNVGYASAAIPLYFEAPPPQPPTAIIRAQAGAQPGEVQLSGTSSFAAPGRTIAGYSWSFSNGGGSTQAEVTRTFTGPGPWFAQLTVTDSRGETNTAFRLISDSLAITNVVLDPQQPTTDDTETVATATVENTGITPLTGVTVAATATPPEVAGAPTGGATPFSLAPGQERTVQFRVPLLAAGEAAVRVTATGTGQFFDAEAAPVRVPFRVSGSDLGVTVRGPDGPVKRGDPAEITATIANGGELDLVDIVPGLTVDPAEGVTVGAPSVPTIARLNSGADPVEVTWTVTATRSGPLDVEVTATGRDDTAAATERIGKGRLQLEVIDRELEVNRTGDQPNHPDAQADGLCDVDVDTEGLQCTLRAALGLRAELDDDVVTIRFAIEGDGVPTISPATDLPQLERSTIIDGRSQPGGWVHLDGGAAPEDAVGLWVDDGTSVVRGMVVSRFRTGILLNGGRGHVLVGNRIGTDPTGTAAAGNRYGVRVIAAKGTVIGGVAGTEVDRCAGDCNLISGNEDFGVNVETNGEATVIGNTIGADVVGNAPVPNGAAVGVTSDLGGQIPAKLVLGLPTGSPGVAPGNVLAGSESNDLVVSAAAEVSVRGNVFGLRRDGTARLRPGSEATRGLSGMHVTDAGATVTVGGVGPGDRNLIAGYEPPDVAGVPPGAGAAIRVSRGAVTVTGNWINVDATGARAVPSRGGVVRDQFSGPPAEIVVRGNVISGTEGPAVLGADLVVGNRIGTDRTGTVAVPNRSGVVGSDVVGGARPAGSRACSDPCNLISGNRGVAVASAGEVQGNFIGTDLSGTAALPNATELDDQEVSGERNATVMGVQALGGASNLLATGTCDLACNVIAGNARRAVTQSPLVEGNLIGEGIDGRALPNAGAGVLIIEDGARVGGVGDRGNRIANNAGPAVEVRLGVPGESTSVRDLQVRGNAMVANADGISFVRSTGAVPPDPPTLRRAVRSGAQVRVDGDLFAAVAGLGSGARIDVYGARSCEPGGQGEVPIGSTSIGIITDGRWSVEATLGTSFPVVVAVASLGGVTSEFSQCAAVRSGGSTRTTADAAAGADRVEVASNDGFAAGQYVVLDEGGDAETVRRVRAIGSLIFDAPLPRAIASGTIVEVVDPPGGDTDPPVLQIVGLDPGAVLDPGASVEVDASCDDGAGVGVEGCEVDEVDTTTPGPRTLRARSWDRNGNAAVVSVPYRVAAGPPATDPPPAPEPPPATEPGPPAGAPPPGSADAPTAASGTLARTGHDPTPSTVLALCLIGAGCLLVGLRRGATGRANLPRPPG